MIKAGATSQSVYIEVLDSTSTTGGRKTGLVYNTAGLTAYYARNAGSATAITLATLAAANSAYSSGGFKEVDATNMPGVYRLDLPDAAIAAGVPSVVVTVRGATGMVQVSLEIQLTAIDLQDAVRGGMTALPNANAEAAGGLYTRGSGAGQINQPANGQIDVNTVKLSGTTQTARDLGASVLLSSGTGTGQLDFTGGVVKANLAQILGTALTETAGQIAAAFKKFFDKATPTGTINSLPDAVAGAAGGVFIAGSNAATTANITGNITGNLSGSVGSVTGAVGSVTGAVGSVTGAVGSVTGNVGGSVGSVAAGGITAASIATGAIDADALAADAVTEIRALASGTADSGTTTTMVDAARTEADTDYWAGDVILFTSGNISGQARVITAFDPATDTITFTPATTQAVAAQTYEIIPGARAVLAGITHTSARVPNVTLVDTLTTYTGNTPQTGDTYARLGAPAGASVSADIAAVKSDSAAILVDTGTTLDARIPAALVGGRMDASVGAMAANTLTASALAADAVTEMQTGLSTLTTGDIPTAAANADAVWDEAIAGHLGAGSTGEKLNAAGSAGDPWTTPLPGAYGAGTAGKIVGDNLNATVGSRSSHSAADVWAVATRTLTAISDSSGITTLLSRIASALAITAGKVDVNDKTGFALTAAYDPAKTAAQAGDSMALTSAERNATADALLDRAAGVETGWTPRQSLRVMLASLAGKLSGAATTTVTIRDVGDTKARITATVDTDGNRSAVTLDAT
jgi:hypothetical protein